MPTEHPQNRRDSGRFEADFECLCAGVHQKGSGVIEDISYRGALIGTTRVVPDRGELVGLGLELANLGAVVLIGRMVRLTISGFAIEFDHLDARAKEFVDSVAAIVHGREIWRSSRPG